jgi:hypothetical protein
MAMKPYVVMCSVFAHLFKFTQATSAVRKQLQNITLAFIKAHGSMLVI